MALPDLMFTGHSCLSLFFKLLHAEVSGNCETRLLVAAPSCFHKCVDPLYWKNLEVFNKIQEVCHLLAFLKKFCSWQGQCHSLHVVYVMHPYGTLNQNVC